MIGAAGAIKGGDELSKVLVPMKSRPCLPPEKRNTLGLKIPDGDGEACLDVDARFDHHAVDDANWPVCVGLRGGN